MTTTIVIFAIILFVIFGSNNNEKTTTTKTVSTNKLNEKGMNLYQDLKTKMDNGTAFKINSEYLNQLGIDVNETFCMDDIYQRIFTETDKTMEDVIMGYVVVLSDRHNAEQPQYKCKTEQEVTEINLQNGELLVQEWGIEWKEEKTVTTGVTYGGVRMSGKGAFKSAFGHMNLIRHTETDFHSMGLGVLYLTSKRLIFVGDNQTKTIKLDKVLNVEVFQDSLIVNKESGKSPMIVPRGSWGDSVTISQYITRVVFDDVELAANN